jgi:carboxyl-terminal processing protease
MNQRIIHLVSTIIICVSFGLATRCSLFAAPSAGLAARCSLLAAPSAGLAARCSLLAASSDDSELRKIIKDHSLKQLTPDALNNINEDNLKQNLDRYSTVYDQAVGRYRRAEIDGNEPFGMDADKYPMYYPVTISEILVNGTAYIDGLAVGDEIIAVNGDAVTSSWDMFEHQAMNTERKLDVTIKRAKLEYTVTLYPRGRRFRSVVGMMSNGIGYVNVGGFTSGSADAMRKLFTAFKEQGATRYIIDLRGTPGGRMDECLEMLELFSHKGDTLVIIDNAAGEERVFLSQTTGPFYGESVDILVDHKSVSASEMFALVAQDNSFGRIIGTVTEGKGRYNIMEELSDGRVVQLTTGRYYSRKHRSIDYEYGSDGVQPDAEHRWTSRRYLWIQRQGNALGITPKDMRALRMVYPEPNAAALDSLLGVYRIDSTPDNRNYYAVVIWGRLGMAIEAFNYYAAKTEQPVPAAPSRSRKGRRL